MTSPGPHDVVGAFRAFLDRIGPLDPDSEPVAVVGLRTIDEEAHFTVSGSVARAFVEALSAYLDPRDRGPCDHCGGRRLDDNFLCRDCHRPNGLFGQLILERAERYAAEGTFSPEPPRY